MIVKFFPQCFPMETQRTFSLHTTHLWLWQFQKHWRHWKKHFKMWFVICHLTPRWPPSHCNATWHRKAAASGYHGCLSAVRDLTMSRWWPARYTIWQNDTASTHSSWRKHISDNKEKKPTKDIYLHMSFQVINPKFGRAASGKTIFLPRQTVESSPGASS